MKTRLVLLAALAVTGCGSDPITDAATTPVATTPIDITIANDACRPYDGAQSVSPKRVLGFWRSSPDRGRAVDVACMSGVTVRVIIPAQPHPASPVRAM